jgi:hypothetical protein
MMVYNWVIREHIPHRDAVISVDAHNSDNARLHQRRDFAFWEVEVAGSISPPPLMR